MFSIKEIEAQEVSKKQMIAEIKAIEGIANAPTKIREVLDEETFIEGLEKIITRDYFPELHRLLEYKKWKEEQTKAGVNISDLLSERSKDESTKRSVFDRDTEKMTVS